MTPNPENAQEPVEIPKPDAKPLPVLSQEPTPEALVNTLPDVNQAILDHFLEINNKGEFTNPPQTPDELHLFIQVAFGVDIPRKAVIPGHSAPFDFVSDLFFQKVKNALAFANRAGGKDISLSTPIITENKGWVLFGDLEVGDTVFAFDGSPTRVVELSEIKHEQTCYSISFDCGEVIVADAEHVWFASRDGAPYCNWLTEAMFRVGGRFTMPLGEVTDELIAAVGQLPAVPGARHTIVRIELAESVPVRCIGIDHPSHLYLLGRNLIPTHNTYDVAILNFLDMLFKPGCEIASAGAVLTQATQCYKYFIEFINMPWFVRFDEKYRNVTGRSFKAKENKQEAGFDNGSVQSIIVATEKGLRSPHPQKARLDEIDLLEWETLQTGLSMARSKGRSDSKNYIRAQNVFTSTRQVENGSMQKLLDQASAKSIAVYEWNIWDVLEPCPRKCIGDPVHGDCPIFEFCQGRAHESQGFFPIDDFISSAQLLDRSKFETEWENKRPSRERLVYSMFEPSKHVIGPERLEQMTGHRVPQATWQIVSGMDFGATQDHPYVYLKCCQLPYNGAWLVFHEYFSRGATLREHAQAIKSSPFWRAGEAIFSDWDAQDRRELRELGVKVVTANKDLEMGINHIQTLMRGTLPKEEPMIYVWGAETDRFRPCLELIKQLGMYSYPTGLDGKPVSSKPIKIHDDGPDALRYALYSWKTKGLTKYRSYTIEGI